MGKSIIRCAIYARKSSEEGLEQSFNSLDAQRDACEAFIASQRHEGWVALKTHYADGGFSGGNMDRPALKQLLEDIEAGKVNLVIVYKVDRLTRSLMDFAKIIERFDTCNVSFVSVTQQFNTTSSMGRLTLNVLLSFAQFEREVTGERIRDKIAASKRKGIFMGGNVPIGYRVRNRKLEVHEEEARIVREIYEQYAKFKTLSPVIEFFKEKQRRTRKTLRLPTSPGSYYHLLSNRMYIGEIKHKGNSYPGQHEPIVTRESWNQVAATRELNARRKKKRIAATKLSRPLTGLLYDAAGARYTPTFTMKDGKRYHYYTSQTAIRDKNFTAVSRIPAEALEELIERSFLQWMVNLNGVEQHVSKSQIAVLKRLTRTKTQQWADMRKDYRWAWIGDIIQRVVASEEVVELRLSISGLYRVLEMPSSEGGGRHANATVTQLVEWDRSRVKGQTVIQQVAQSRVPDPVLIKALARARRWYERIVAGEVGSLEVFAKEEGFRGSYARRVFNCALIEPSLVESVLEGRAHLFATFSTLSAPGPVIWPTVPFSK